MAASSRERLTRALLAAPDGRSALALAKKHRESCDRDLARELVKRYGLAMAQAPRKARAAVVALDAVARASRDPELGAIALSVRGSLAQLEGRASEARRCLTRAAEMHRRAGRRAQEADAWRALVEVERHAGDEPRALAAFRRATKALDAAGPEPLRRGHLLTNLGNIHFQADRHEKALEAYAAARTLLLQARDESAVAACDYNRANILTTLDRTEEARALYESARDAFSRRSLAASVAQCDYGVAGLDVLEGRLDAALAELIAVAERCESLGDAEGRAHAELDAADALLRLNRLADAEKHARRSREHFRRAKQAANVASCDAILGGAALQAGRSREAVRSFRGAIEERLAAGNRVAAATATTGLAAAELRSGRAGRAIELARTAAARLERARLPGRAGRAMVVAAEAHLALGQVGRAEAVAAKAVSLSHRREPRVEMTALLARAKAAEAAGHPERAHAFLLEAASIVESMRLGVTTEESQLAFGLDKSEVFEALVLNRLAVGTPEAVREALQHAESGKSRALAERLARGRASDVASPAARQALKRLRALDRRLAVAESKLEKPEGIPGLRSHRESAATHLTEQRRRLLDALQRRAPQEALAAGVARVDPWAGVGALRGGEIALEYVEAGGDLHLFAIEHGRIDAFRAIARMDRIRDEVDRLRFQLGKGVLGEHHAEAHREFLAAAARRRLESLFDLLLGPVADRLEGRGVRIVPHGTLHGLPFHALERDGRPLLERAIVSHAPSLAVLGLLGRAPAALAPPLVLGVPDHAAPEIEAEVTAIGRHVDRARVFRGAEATTEALRIAEDRPNVLHVACHGLFTDGGGSPGALRLGDAWLTLPELQAMRATGELVVLSGCETGRGMVHAGDEWVGLVRAFLLAGARCVVASLWEVHDRSTAQLMDEFYGHLASGTTVGEALALAQREARRRGASLLHWAPFVAVGDPQFRLDLRRAA